MRPRFVSAVGRIAFGEGLGQNRGMKTKRAGRWIGLAAILWAAGAVAQEAPEPVVLTVLGTCVLRLIWVFTVCRIWPDYRVLMLVYPITWALTGAAIMVCYFLVDSKLAKKFLTAQTH